MRRFLLGSAAAALLVSVPFASPASAAGCGDTIDVGGLVYADVRGTDLIPFIYVETNGIAGLQAQDTGTTDGAWDDCDTTGGGPADTWVF